MAAGVQTSARYVLIGGPRESGRDRANAVKNPSLEVNTALWTGTASTGSPAVSRALDGYVGAYALDVTNTLTGAGNVRARYAEATPTSDGIAVAVGERVYVRAAGKIHSLSTSSVSSLRLIVRWRTSASVFIADDIAVSLASPTTGTWYELAGAVVAPATAAYGTLIVEANVDAAATVALRADQAFLALASGTADPDYFDGDSPGYYWTGTAHASASAQDGTRAVLNDSDDPDFVGSVSEITGLESAEIRESSVDNVEEDGALHGEFYQGRRPITITTQIGGNTTVTSRNLRQGRYLAAARALRIGGITHRQGVLRWQPLGYPEMYSTVRANQSSRMTGQWIKDGALALVAADPRIYGVQRKRAYIYPNLIPNPSFEVDTSGWTTTGSSGGFVVSPPTLSRITSWSTAGVASARVQATMPNDTTNRSAYVLTPSGTAGIAVSPDTSYVLTAEVNHIDAPALGSGVTIDWYTAAGALISTNSGTLIGVNTVGQFRPFVTATSPSNAAFARVRLRSNTATVNDVIDAYWDAVMFTEGSAQVPYVDDTVSGRTYDRSYDVNYAWGPEKGRTTVTNVGDGDAPLIFTLYGPSGSFALQNLTTAEEISLGGSLLAGDVLTIDTLRKSVTLNGNINAYDRVELTRTFWWGLAPYDNVLAIQGDQPPLRWAVDWQDAWA